MLRARRILGIYFSLLVPVAAQPQLTARDSLRILGDARSAQSRFERTRHHFIPAGNGPDDRPCEAQVGRMCYWQEDPEEERLPEPKEIAKARMSLLATLGRLNAMSPGDNWIAGERVRYTVESGQDSAAVAVAQSCSPPRWYCNVLRGYALHSSGKYADAEAAYDSALAAMPATERCRWNDISMLLDDDQREGYTRLPCGQRDSIETRFWELAQPSFAVGGNDRRTEHFSRVLLADLSQNAANAYGLTWGADMRELLLRYGSPAWYSTTWPRPMSPDPTPIGHDRTPSFHFAAEVKGDSVQWNAYARAARERYAPPYIDTITTLPAQFAMLKRGDSALVVAVYASSLPDSADEKTFLGIDGAVSDTAPAQLPQAHVRRARSEWKGMMVAMEAYDPARRMASRAREWLAPPRHVPGAPDLSTLLLYSADSAASVETLDDALANALTTSDLRGTRRLGLYWEVYGGRAANDPADSASAPPAIPDSQTVNQPANQPAGTDDSSSVLVTVERTDSGIMRWLGQALRIVRRDSPLVVRWRDSHAETGIAAHSIVLDLTDLSSGTYRVTVAGGPDDAHRTSVSRQIRLR